MKLCSFDYNNILSYCLIIDDGIIDLGKRLSEANLGQRLSMANPYTADEIRACKEAEIDLFVCGMDQIDDVRAITSTHFLPGGVKMGAIRLK